MRLLAKTICLVAITSAVMLASTYVRCETTAPSAGTISLTVESAIQMALENNTSLRVERMNPEITRLKEETAKSVFDPSVSGSISNTQSKSASDTKSHRSSGSAGLSQKLKSGSEVTFGLSSDNSGSSASAHSSRLGVSLTTPLARDAGTTINLAGVKQAELDTQAALLDLQGYTESLVNQVIGAYWDYSLATREVAIYEESLKLAQQQLDETSAMVEVGKLAEIELIAAKAETALREQSLVDIRSRLESLRIKLVRLINPGAAGELPGPAIDAAQPLVPPETNIGTAKDHLEKAMKSRSDLNRARISIERGDLEVVKTRNGLLPYLSLFATLGGTGYSSTFFDSFGGITNDGYDLQLGFSYKRALGLQSEKARFKQTVLSQEQSAEALRNMELLAREEILNDWLEIERSGKQISSSGATVALQEEKLRAETEKYKVGKSTSLNVAQAQRDLLQSQVNQASAVADYIKAIAALRYSEGGLLQDYGVVIMK